MNKKLHDGMLEATRLTRAGKLGEATAMIQKTLRSMMARGPSAEASDPGSQTGIDGECRGVDEPPVLPVHIGEPQSRPELEPSHANVERMDQSSPALGAGLQEQLLQHWHGFATGSPGFEPLKEPIPEIVPDGGRFITASYTNQAGTRSYKLYVPSGYCAQPLPLIIMLHGCMQGPDDFAVGTRMNELAEEHLCLVAYPAQTNAANISKCWNWFTASDPQRDEGEPSIIAGLTRQILEDYVVDTRRIYVAGLSAGAAMAATMATNYPELYAAAGIHSGPRHGVPQDLPSTFAAMQGGGSSTLGGRAADTVPTIVFHGDRDATVPPSNSEQVIAQFVPPHAGSGISQGTAEAPRVTVQPGQVPGGHAYTRTIYHDASGQPIVEHWLIHGAGHAWSGGNSRGSYTDPAGPDATREMLRFFLEHPQSATSGRVA